MHLNQINLLLHRNLSRCVVHQNYSILLLNLPRTKITHSCYSIYLSISLYQITQSSSAIKFTQFISITQSFFPDFTNGWMEYETVDSALSIFRLSHLFSFPHRVLMMITLVPLDRSGFWRKHSIAFVHILLPTYTFSHTSTEDIPFSSTRLNPPQSNQSWDPDLEADLF